jgi:hypothetical protein
MEYARSADFGGYTGVKAVKYGKPCAGLLCNYVVTFKAVRETRELIPVVVPCCGDFDVDELERMSSESEPLSCDSSLVDGIVERAFPSLESLIAGARERLALKIGRRVETMSDDLDFSIDPQLEKIRDSYARAIKELENKLELHKSKMKWYGGDLKSVITRTSNKILLMKKEKEHLLATYRGYLGIEYSAAIVNAGFIIGV